MRNFYILIVLIAISFTVSGQTVDISFSKAADTLKRSSSEINKTIVLEIKKLTISKDSLSLYSLVVKSDDSKSTLAKSAYSLNFETVSLDKLKEDTKYKVLLTINKDTLSDRNRNINLTFEILKAGKAQNINVTAAARNQAILVQGTQTISKYNYLAYLGTNFDLVDGVRAKNLFFATNFFVAPEKGRGFGFNLVLYGNRAMTTTDTTSNERVVSRLKGTGTNTIVYYDNAKKMDSRVTDNLGAAFSLLIRLGSLSDEEKASRLFYAPQAELIWRRTTQTTKYSDRVPADSAIRSSSYSAARIMPDLVKKSYNVYDVNLGLGGLAFVHENESISLRVQACIGYNISYTSRAAKSTEIEANFDRGSNMFFSSRAWITEPKSGITFGAEVSNNLIRNHRPYYNVTLSKAFNLDVIAGILKPVSTR